MFQQLATAKGLVVLHCQYERGTTLVVESVDVDRGMGAQKPNAGNITAFARLKGGEEGGRERKREVSTV